VLKQLDLDGVGLGVALADGGLVATSISHPVQLMSVAIRQVHLGLWTVLGVIVVAAGDFDSLQAQVVAEEPASARTAEGPRLALEVGPAVVLPPAAPADSARLRIFSEAQRVRGRRLMVSLNERRVWLMEGDAVVFTAPVAVGKSVVLEWDEKSYSFATPPGRRQVLGKQKNPVWVPPDWHYVEVALSMGWKLEEIRPGRPFTLSDGTKVAAIGERLGRLLPDGKFVPVPAGEEAVFDGTLFMPPVESVNRRIPGELGLYKLDLGDDYYFHGTPYPSSIGTASTHGCIRLLDADIEYLYRNVSVGTPVFLY
jgi:hypothetical protein